MPEFKDKSFDLVHSNSVIEHVGSFQNMERFANEVRRVGVAYFVQTPSFGFPVDPHYGVPFIHWFPDPIRIWAFTRFRIGFVKKREFQKALFDVDHSRIVSKYILCSLFQDARLIRERFMLSTKSITVVRDYND